MSLNLLNKKIQGPQLWLAKVEGRSHSLDSDFLDESSIERYKQLSSSKRRQQFLLSRWLIKKAVHHLFAIPISDVKIDENINNRPNITPLPQAFFYSLSHSHDWVALLFSTSPCGIDIEKKKPRNNMVDMAKSFMSEREYHLYSINQSRDYFYRCWCAKEAFYKSLSTSQQTVTPFHTIDTERRFSSSTSTLVELTSEQYQLTIFDSSAITAIDAFFVGYPPSLRPCFTPKNPTLVNWNILSPIS